MFRSIELNKVIVFSNVFFMCYSFIDRSKNCYCDRIAEYFSPHNSRILGYENFVKLPRFIKMTSVCLSSSQASYAYCDASSKVACESIFATAVN